MCVVGRVLPTADKGRLRFEGMSETFTVSSQVIGHEVLIHGAGESQDTISLATAARVDVGEHKHPGVHLGADVEPTVGWMRMNEWAEDAD